MPIASGCIGTVDRRNDERLKLPASLSHPRLGRGQQTFAATEHIAAHSDAGSRACSLTLRTERSRSSAG
jgi:hypothetical protein